MMGRTSQYEDGDYEQGTKEFCFGKVHNKKLVNEWQEIYITKRAESSGKEDMRMNNMIKD